MLWSRTEWEVTTSCLLKDKQLVMPIPDLRTQSSEFGLWGLFLPLKFWREEKEKGEGAVCRMESLSEDENLLACPGPPEWEE